MTIDSLRQRKREIENTFLINSFLAKGRLQIGVGGLIWCTEINIIVYVHNTQIIQGRFTIYIYIVVGGQFQIWL